HRERRRAARARSERAHAGRRSRGARSAREVGGHRRGRRALREGSFSLVGELVTFDRTPGPIRDLASLAARARPKERAPLADELVFAVDGAHDISGEAAGIAFGRERLVADRCVAAEVTAVLAATVSIPLELAVAADDELLHVLGARHVAFGLAGISL